MDTSEAQVFSRCLLVTDLSISGSDDVIRASMECPLKTGEFFCRQGNSVGKFGVLLRGRLGVVLVGRTGAQVILRFINPGDVFSYAHALSGEPAVASIQAMEDSATLEWDSETLIGFMRKYPSIARSFATAVVEHTREMWTHLQETLTESCERRLIRELWRAFGAASDVARDREINLTEQQIADYLGTTPYTVSRILSRLRREGVIEIHRGRIRIVAPRRLETLEAEYQTL